MSRCCGTSPSPRCRSRSDEALDLIGELKGAALLDGVRGAPPADRAALAELMVALSRFAADHAERIAEIDLNPVIVHPEGQGLTVVDALIVEDGRTSPVTDYSELQGNRRQPRRPGRDGRNPPAAAQFLRRGADRRDRRGLRAARRRPGLPRHRALPPRGGHFCAGADFSKRMDTGTVQEGEPQRRRQASLQGGEPPVPHQKADRRRDPRARRSAAGWASRWCPISASPATRRGSAPISTGSASIPASA